MKVQMTRNWPKNWNRIRQSPTALTTTWFPRSTGSTIRQLSPRLTTGSAMVRATITSFQKSVEFSTWWGRATFIKFQLVSQPPSPPHPPRPLRPGWSPLSRHRRRYRRHHGLRGRGVKLYFFCVSRLFILIAEIDEICVGFGRNDFRKLMIITYFSPCMCSRRALPRWWISKHARLRISCKSSKSSAHPDKCWKRF